MVEVPKGGHLLPVPKAEEHLGCYQMVQGSLFWEAAPKKASARIQTGKRGLCLDILELDYNNKLLSQSIYGNENVDGYNSLVLVGLAGYGVLRAVGSHAR
jgi:hypothetical protein